MKRWTILKSQLQNLSPEVFKKAIENDKSATIIDVRTKEEFDCGSLSNAVNVDYLGYDFLDYIETLDNTSVYYVYCRTERRSIRACTLMINGGLENVYNLDGGLNAWASSFPEFQL